MKKYILVLIGLIFYQINSLFAFTVKGRVAELQEGEKVYLYTNPLGVCEHKWGLSIKVDSTVVLMGGDFVFQVPDVEYGRLWMICTKEKLLYYFFNRNEHLKFEGKLDLVGLRRIEAQEGRDQLLFKDAESFLGKADCDPIEKRISIDWLKRHAMEDVAVWATNYFYTVDGSLNWREVREILACIPENQFTNPFYQTLKVRYDQAARIQPGQILRELEIRDKYSGKRIPERKPVLLYIFSYYTDNFAGLYLEQAQKLSKLIDEFPDLQLVLVCPEWEDSIHLSTLSALKKERIYLAGYEELMTAYPYLASNRKQGGRILMDKNRCVLSLDKRYEELKSVLSATTEYKPHFLIHGYVTGMGKGIAELVIPEENKLKIVDSAEINHGYFCFKGALKRPEYCNVGIRNTIYPVGFFLDNEETDVLIHASEVQHFEDGKIVLGTALNGKVYGSKLQTDFEYFQTFKTKEEIDTLVGTHAFEPAILFYLAYVLMADFPAEQTEQWLNMLDNKLTKYREYNEIREQIRKQKALIPGKKVPGFTLSDNKGKRVLLKDYREKYVLLDFWASWCGPCRAEIPNLKAIWEKFHDCGLEMISISIDRKKTEWEKALLEEQMGWRQLWDEDGKVAQQYNVQGVPHILLLDKEGKIVGLNLRGQQLVEKLEEILK